MRFDAHAGKVKGGLREGVERLNLKATCEADIQLLKALYEALWKHQPIEFPAIGMVYAAKAKDVAPPNEAIRAKVELEG